MLLNVTQRANRDTSKIPSLCKLSITLSDINIDNMTHITTLLDLYDVRFSKRASFFFLSREKHSSNIHIRQTFNIRQTYLKHYMF